MSYGLRRASKLLLGTLLVFALLVATHRGEFWPFSIYPMFSQAGDPWSRAVVRDLSSDPSSLRWEAMSLNELPGHPFALRPNGVNNIDLANFVSKTDRWTPQRREGLRSLFRPHLPEHDLLVMRVNGRMIQRDSVEVEFVPSVLITSDTTLLNPDLRSSPRLNE